MKEYKVTAREISIDVNGLNFLCIFGSHINGGYISIVNWGVSAELSAVSDFSNIDYNSDSIYNALLRSDLKSWLPRLASSRKEISVCIAEKISDIMKKQAVE